MWKQKKIRTKLRYFRMKRGFTLIELLVAMVAASVVSLAALQMYVQYHRVFMQLYAGYQRESTELLETIRQMNPYGSGALRGSPR